MAASSQSEFFTDKSLEELTAINPVKDALGGWLEVFKKTSEFHPSYWAAIFKGSPVVNEQAEILFGRLVKAAAENGKWVGKRIGPSESLDCLLQGIKKAEAKGLLTLRYSDREYSASPTNGLLLYVNSRLREFSPFPLKQDHPFITRRRFEALKAIASLDYRNGYVDRIKEVLHVEESTAKHHIEGMKSKLKCYDVPSLIYASLDGRYLLFKEVVGKNLQDLEDRYKELTRVEKGVLSAFAASALEGDASSKGIAKKIQPSVSQATARNHLYNMYQKLGIGKRGQLAIYAYYHVNMTSRR